VTQPNACADLARTAQEIAAETPEISARDFLLELGWRVAGIEPGVEGFIDLARGGENIISGGGFQPEFDDGTSGQARHFAGIATAVAKLGSRFTTWAGERALRDSPDSADGRLSEAAITFARALLDGDLPVADADEWIETHLCLAAASNPNKRVSDRPGPR
jgi:hypothetical protein